MEGGAGGSFAFGGGTPGEKASGGGGVEEHFWAFGKRGSQERGLRTTSPPRNRKWLPREVFTSSLQVKKRKGTPEGGRECGVGGPQQAFRILEGAHDPCRGTACERWELPSWGFRGRKRGSAFLRGQEPPVQVMGGGGWGVCASESPAGSPPSLRGPGLAYEKSGLLAGVTGCGLRAGGRGGAGSSWTGRGQLSAGVDAAGGGGGFPEVSAGVRVPPRAGGRRCGPGPSAGYDAAERRAFRARPSRPQLTR